MACVLHVGPGCDFDASYVEKLCVGVAKHLPLPHRFVCLSNVDVPCERIPLIGLWKGWWAKMELYRPDIEAERIFYLDLDTVIVGDLTEIATIDTFTMTDNFLGEGYGAGVMMLADRRTIWNDFTMDPSGIIGHFRSDQEYLSPKCRHQFDDFVPGQVVSFKRDVRRQDALPENARVVSFHGKPRPHQLPDDHWMRRYW